MRSFRQVKGFAIEKHIVDEAQRVGHGKDTRQRHRRRQQPAKVQTAGGTDGFCKKHLFRQKTIEQRHAGHRSRRHHRQHRRMRHEFPQAVDAAHVARAGLVVDNSGGHEQRRLEYGMVDDMEHPGHGSKRCANAEQQRDQPQMADGGIRQQALEIVLEQRDISAQQQRGQARTAHQPRPFRRTGQRRKQACQQEYARLDHGG